MSKRSFIFSLLFLYANFLFIFLFKSSKIFSAVILPFSVKQIKMFRLSILSCFFIINPANSILEIINAKLVFAIPKNFNNSKGESSPFN